MIGERNGMTRRGMLRSATPLAAAVFGGFGLAACREEPIYVGPTISFVGRGTGRDRAEQIRRAAAEHGWSTRELRMLGARDRSGRVFQQGIIEASNPARGHNIVVNITYDVRQFTVRYISSTGLNYDGQRIHTYYNGTVENLERAIMRASA